ncbi:MAG: DMT family transporter [Conexivisphaerales archaeon]
MTQSDKNKGHVAGIVFALASAVTYGAVSTLGKLALSNSSPVYISATAYVIGAAILFTFKPKERPQRSLLLLILITGILGAGIAPYLFFRGLDMTTAADAALLSNGEALFTTVLALLFFKERLNGLQAAAAVIVFIGLIAVTTNLDVRAVHFFEGLEGNITVLLATLVWGIDNNLSRIVGQRMNPTVFTRYKNIIGSAFLLSILLASNQKIVPSQDSILYIMLIGVFAVGLSTAFLMNALSRLGAIRAVMLFSTASIFGLLFAVIVLKEEVTYVQAAGAITMFTGLYLLNRRHAG